MTGLNADLRARERRIARRRRLALLSLRRAQRAAAPEQVTDLTAPTGVAR